MRILNCIHYKLCHGLKKKGKIKNSTIKRVKRKTENAEKETKKHTIETIEKVKPSPSFRDKQKKTKANFYINNNNLMEKRPANTFFSKNNAKELLKKKLKPKGKTERKSKTSQAIDCVN